MSDEQTILLNIEDRNMGGICPNCLCVDLYTECSCKAGMACHTCNTPNHEVEVYCDSCQGTFLEEDLLSYNQVNQARGVLLFIDGFGVTLPEDHRPDMEALGITEGDMITNQIIDMIKTKNKERLEDIRSVDRLNQARHHAASLFSE